MAFQSRRGAGQPELVTPPVAPESVLTREDKWKAVSHLQKCIRRGWVDLVGPAVDLCHDLDPAYTRYRLSVIAFEDIAGGNPDLIAESFADGWTKKAIEAKGGKDWLRAQALLWAGGPKDRLASDLLACLAWKKDFESIHGPWEGLTVPQALDIAWNERSPWWSRALAFWRASGTTRYPDSRLPEKMDGDEPLLLESMQGKVADSVALCVKAGLSQRESAPVFLPLVADARRGFESRPPTALSPALNTPVMVGPWVSIALDRHTREGQKALSWAWFNAGWKEAFEPFGATQEEALSAVARMQFWMEGGLLDPSLDYPLKKEVGADSRKRTISHWPFTARELHTIAGDARVWTEARLHVLGFSAPAMKGVRP